jgi:hypothetical protein
MTALQPRQTERATPTVPGPYEKFKAKLVQSTTQILLYSWVKDAPLAGAYFTSNLIPSGV